MDSTALKIRKTIANYQSQNGLYELGSKGRDELSEAIATALREDSEIARLRALVDECLDLIEQVPDDIQFWADYASDYFQTKHKLAEFISRYTDFIDKHRPAPPEAQEERS